MSLLGKLLRKSGSKTVSKFIFFNLFAAFFNLSAIFLNLFVAFFNLFVVFFNLFAALFNLSVSFFNLFAALFSLFAAFINLFVSFFSVFASRKTVKAIFADRLCSGSQEFENGMPILTGWLPS